MCACYKSEDLCDRSRGDQELKYAARALYKEEKKEEEQEEQEVETEAVVEVVEVETKEVKRLNDRSVQ